MSTLESIKTRTMRRVVAVYYLRKVINRVTLKVGLLGFTTLAFGSLVHVAAIGRNMPTLTDIGSVYQFSLSAFLHTGVLVQLVIAMSGTIIFLLLKDVLKVVHLPTLKLAS